MFTEKLTALQSALSLTNAEIAKSGNCSESQISRIKKAHKNPAKNSKVTIAIAEGIYNCAKERNNLSSVFHALKLNRDATSSDILDWLFLENASDISVLFDKNEDSSVLVSRRMNAIIQLSGLSNKSIGKAVAISESTFSRIRNEKKHNTDPIISLRICIVLYEEIKKKNNAEQLSSMMHVSKDELEKQAIPLLHEWLFQTPVKADWQKTATTFLAVSPAVECKEIYTGKTGLQKAVTRFLTEAAESGGEICLYSDQSMDWMTGSFQKEWSMLMMNAIKNGVRIVIIHNLNRDTSEMVNAITKWLPLYMKGSINSYVNLNPEDSLYSHTVFLHKGHSVISSFGLKKNPDDAEYRYLTDKKSLKHWEHTYSDMLAQSAPLISYSNEVFEKYDLTTNDMGIKVTKNNVYISHLSSQNNTLVFSYPNIGEKFSKYIASVGKASNPT
ncbi:MAG: hypothetical protein K6F37_06020 [Lachnospiraceae bacterium]|nr:hypothetical protein [Lachnospiraceae bacterium]